MCISIARLRWSDYVDGSRSGRGGVIFMSVWLTEGGRGVVET